MFKPIALFIGLRYTKAKRRDGFISFISAISIGGLALGVCVLIVVLSVMNGFDRELKQRILGMVPHATINATQDQLDNWQSIIKLAHETEGVVAATPFTQTQGIVTNNGQIQGIMCYGIDPSLENNSSVIKDYMVHGDLVELKAKEFGIVMGAPLAQLLNLSIGDKVILMLPDASITLAGVFPRMKRFTLIGTFSIGADLDTGLVYSHIKDINTLLRNEEPNGIRLKMHDLFEAPSIAQSIASQLPGDYKIRDWTETQGQLFQAIQMEKTMVGLLLTLIIAVAAFNIISTLIMIVNDKRSDIAILRTLGASRTAIMNVFMVQGCYIGIIGTLLGVVIGVLAASNISQIIVWIEHTLQVHFLSPDVYFISHLPSQLNWADIILVSFFGFIMSFLATIYPAWRASKIQPAEALRYE